MIEFDRHIPYLEYYLEHVAKAKKLGDDQLTGLCPFHEDHESSFGVNLETGKWLCRTGCGSGNIVTFEARLRGISNRDATKELCARYNIHESRSGSDGNKKSSALDISPDVLKLFEKIPPEILKFMIEVRGWSTEIIAKHRIGYNAKKLLHPGRVEAERITIPIFNEFGRLVNIRLYKPRAQERKMLSWSTKSEKTGFGKSRLYPHTSLTEAKERNELIYILEGEPDCLCGLSRGLLCITNTTGADSWRDEWNPLFKGLRVRIIYDNDEAGRKGISKILKHLPAFAAGVEFGTWPEWMGEKEDLTDWFVKYGKTKEDLETLTWRAASESGNDEDDPVAQRIQEVNKTHAIVMLGGKCLIMNEIVDPVFGRPDINFSAPSDFKTCYQNQPVCVVNGSGETKSVTLGSLWLGHKDRREYAGIVFSPGEETPGYYNLYQGFAYQPRKGCWDRLRNHIGEVICGNDDRLFEYTLAWMADTIQDPGGDRPGVAIVMRGAKGVGKGLFARTFGELFGSHFLHITHQSQLTGKFNNHQKDALVVFADECFWAGDKLSEGILKAMITEPTIRVEPKGKDSFAVKNHMRVIIASNDSWVVPAGLGERRFLVVDVENEDKQKNSYFEPIYEEIKRGGHEAMLYDLMQYEYSKKMLFNAPKTEALLVQIEEGLEPVQKFWLEKLKDGRLLRNDDRWRDLASTAKLYAEFLDFSKSLGHHYAPAPNAFARRLRALCPGTGRIKVLKDGSVYEREPALTFGSLTECRKKFEKVLGQSFDWEETE